MTLNTNSSITRIVAAALLSGVGVGAALGLAGTASATYGAGEGPIDAWSNYEWCPGDPIPQSDNPLPFDTTSCHFWHYQTPTAEAPSLYTVVEGIRPSNCPPIAYMCP